MRRIVGHERKRRLLVAPYQHSAAMVGGEIYGAAQGLRAMRAQPLAGVVEKGVRRGLVPRLKMAEEAYAIAVKLVVCRAARHADPSHDLALTMSEKERHLVRLHKDAGEGREPPAIEQNHRGNVVPVAFIEGVLRFQEMGRRIALPYLDLRGRNRFRTRRH